MEPHTAALLRRREQMQSFWRASGKGGLNAFFFARAAKRAGIGANRGFLIGPHPASTRNVVNGDAATPCRQIRSGSTVEQSQSGMDFCW
jgi:hypothetical protein